ncbi:MAG: DUF2398 family protein [Thermodesulfobacteriota bacterium]|nr:DUF2398 family protein [Thermodesulfobacteriota bacterium]
MRTKESMEIELAKLLKRNSERVQTVLNILLESPYFYAADDHDLFLFLRRYRSEFTDFFKQFYGWTLIIDSKCARAYKAEWYNPAITPGNRSLFKFSKRDECLAFMILLEFFEQQLEENGMTVEDKDNLRFHFGDLLDYSHKRFQELFPEQEQHYSQDYIRAKIWKPVMPELEKYRFLTKIAPPEDLQASEQDLIYEAMPALYHYNGAALARMIPDLSVNES